MPKFENNRIWNNDSSIERRKKRVALDLNQVVERRRIRNKRSFLQETLILEVFQRLLVLL